MRSVDVILALVAVATVVAQMVMFLLESVVFALIGPELPALIGDLRNGESAWPAQALAVAGP
jgi:monovalent cation/hydrogen antiporter